MESMDLVEAESKSIPAGSPAGEVTSSYAALYLESFLPAYQMVNQSAVGVADRYKAIKFAADASLALTATGANWSCALSKMLVDDSDRSAPDDFVADDESSSSCDAGFWSATSISSPEPSPDHNSNDLCEPSASSDAESWGRKAGIDSSRYRKGLSRRTSALQRFAGRGPRRISSRNQRLSRDASRLAILRTLSIKSKTRRRFRSSTKPRAVLRKVKSLARHRRRIVAFQRPVEISEPERRFENGLLELQRLVPGGSNLDAPDLLDEAADFVMFLKLQVQALQSVANAVGVEGIINPSS